MKYLSSLFVALALACSKPNMIPSSEEEEEPKQVSLTQHYFGNVNDDFAIYTTGGEDDSVGGEEGCSLELTPTEMSLSRYSGMKINDFNCDGKVDRVTTIYRHYLPSGMGELNEKMKTARVNFDFDYLKFRGTCALIFENKGEGYLVDQGCDDAVDWTVHKIFREDINSPSVIKQMDSVLQKGMALATPEHRHHLEDASIFELLSLESLVNSRLYSPKN